MKRLALETLKFYHLYFNTEIFKEEVKGLLEFLNYWKNSILLVRFFSSNILTLS